MRSYKEILVLFVGPQGAGKTTYTKLLINKIKANNHKVCMINLNNHALFHKLYTRFMDTKVCKIFNECISSKFYKNLPPISIATPKLYRTMFLGVILIHILGFLLSVTKLHLIYRRSCDIIFDHEGFLFKQLADLSWLAKYADLKRSKILWKVYLKLLVIFLFVYLSNLSNKARIIVILLQCNYQELVRRYTKRGIIEPYSYVIFQERFYHYIVNLVLKNRLRFKIFTINTEYNINDVFNTIWSLFKNEVLQIN